MKRTSQIKSVSLQLEEEMWFSNTFKNSLQPNMILRYDSATYYCHCCRSLVHSTTLQLITAIVVDLSFSLYAETLMAQQRDDFQVFHLAPHSHMTQYYGGIL